MSNIPHATDFKKIVKSCDSPHIQDDIKKHLDQIANNQNNESNSYYKYEDIDKAKFIHKCFLDKGYVSSFEIKKSTRKVYKFEQWREKTEYYPVVRVALPSN